MIIVPLPYPGKISAIPLDTMLLISVSRPYVESGQTDEVLAFLNQLTESRETVFRCRDRLVITFDGWSEDRREIHEIPQVVSYFRALHDRWPYWAWFCAKRVEQGVIVTALLSDAATEDRYLGRTTLRILPEQLQQTQQSIFAGLLQLGQRFDIPEPALQVARDRWILELT